MIIRCPGGRNDQRRWGCRGLSSKYLPLSISFRLGGLKFEFRLRWDDIHRQSMSSTPPSKKTERLIVHSSFSTISISIFLIINAVILNVNIPTKVMTLALGIKPAVARDFSLMIQSCGQFYIFLLLKFFCHVVSFKFLVLF